jgi:hypothetical protein
MSSVGFCFISNTKTNFLLYLRDKSGWFDQAPGGSFIHML